jgi:nucleoid-associated protein YgaU
MNLIDVIERVLTRANLLPLKGETMQPTDPTPTPTDPTPPAPAPDDEERVSERAADAGDETTEAPPAVPEPETGTHVVVDGDTLAAIAAAAQCSTLDLINMNKDEYPSLGWNDTLQLGWEIRLPERA